MRFCTLLSIMSNQMSLVTGETKSVASNIVNIQSEIIASFII